MTRSLHKRSHKEPRTRWRCDVPTRVAALVEHQFYNPITAKPDYGARTRLITDLLVQWLSERGIQVPPID